MPNSPDSLITTTAIPAAATAALALLDVEGMIATLVQLVQTPSVYNPAEPGANEAAVAALIVDVLRSWGLQPQVAEIAPGRPNIVADLVGTRSSDGIHPRTSAPRLLLMEGHSDVVTPGNLAAWTYDPFGATIVGRRLYGRGAADMKGGVAAMLYAARAIQLAGAPFDGILRLLIPVDEEGMMSGIKALVAAGYADGALGAIVCEPEGGEVCIAQKGSLRLRLISYGRIAHGAMPREGVNALAGLVRVLNKVLDLEAQLANIYGEHPLLGPAYISPTVAQAPTYGDYSQINCLPDRAEAYLDIRSFPAIEHTALIGRIRRLMEEVRSEQSAYRFGIDVIDDRPSTETAPFHPVVRSLVNAHERIYGSSPALGGVPGSTDGTIITRDRNIPVVVYGPGDKHIPHQPDEYVDLDDVARAAQVYIIAALDLLA
jgi:succinyl-diaminopimelate desuccinylase